MASPSICRECGAPLPGGQFGDRCARCLLETALARNLPPVEEEPGDAALTGPRRLGDYELIEEIGRGGMGVVYRARQISVNRPVAVKLLLAGPLASPEDVQRFRQEAEAVANLHHPNIVSVHGSGWDQGQLYFSMDYVAGRNLAELVRANPLPARQAARYVRTIAGAIQHAHQEGVVHRDLKPSNIIVDAEDQPRITDFGLARRQDDMVRLTITGQALGSPNYMAPEQAGGKQGELGPSCDIYALGAVLYHLLTGRPPFLADTLTATLRLVQETEPIAPRLLNPVVPRDLQVLCLKCLEKAPARRFGSARELAEELERFERGEPILTRPIGSLGRLVRWVRRKPRLAALATAVLALTLVIAVGGPAAVLRIRRERDASLRHAAEETHQRKLADAALHRLEVERAREMFANDDAAGGLATLASLLRQDPADRAVTEWLVHEMTYRSFALPTLPPLTHDDLVFDAEFSPDGRRILTVARDHSARLWDATTGELVAPPLRHDPKLVPSGEFLGPLKPLFARFSPDGTRVVTASIDHTARLWDAVTGAADTPPLAHPNIVGWANFSPGGETLATACEDGIARLWNVADGRPLKVRFSHDKPLSSVEFSMDGHWIVTASRDATAQVWDVHTGQRVGAALRHEEWVRYATFSPDGSLVATVSADSTARIWHRRTGEAATPWMRHDGVVNTAQFSPDGCWLVTGSFDGMARIWDVSTGQPAGQPLRHKGTVRSARFSPEGYRIITASEDGTARVWSLKTGRPLTEPFRHRTAVWSARFSPDGTRAVTASADKTVQVWDVRPGQALERSWPILAGGSSVSWSPDGRKVLAVSRNWAWIINPVDESDARTLCRQTGTLGGEFSPDGTRVVIANADHTARVWDAGTFAPTTPPLPHQATVYSARLSRDGRLVVTASADGTARLWEAGTGNPLGDSLRHGNAVYAAEFSPDDRAIVTACADKAARVWDCRTRLPLGAPLRHGDEVLNAGFSPDGRWILTTSKDHSARVWETGSGEPMGPAMRHDAPLTSAHFSPDGQRVVTSSTDKTARVWDARTGKPVTGPLRHEGTVHAAAFSPDGRRVLTASADRTVRIWEAQSGQPCTGSLTHAKGVETAQFSPDGRWVATAGADHYCHVWAFLPTSEPPPDWLPALAEAVGGRSLATEQGQGTNAPFDWLALRRRLAGTAATNAATAWGSWFLSDRWERPCSPESRETVSVRYGRFNYDAHWDHDRLAKPIVEGLWEAMAYMPDHAYFVANLARLLARESVAQNPRCLAEADWLSRHALGLSPRGEPEAWWARAVYLDRAGNLDDAILHIGQAYKLGPANCYLYLSAGRLLERSGNLTAADAALVRAAELAALRPSQRESGYFALERARFLQRTGRVAEAKPDLMRLQGLVARDPATPARLIDLWSAYNTGFNETYDWILNQVSALLISALPPGRQTLAGVEFDLLGLVQLAGNAPRQSRVDIPQRAPGIPVAQRCRRLHFLHAADGIETDGTAIGGYVIHYADGPSLEFPIIYGRDVVSCVLDPPRRQAPPLAAWEGRSDDGIPLRLFKSTWENPRPETEISTIDFVSRMTLAAPFLVAVTAE